MPHLIPHERFLGCVLGKAIGDALGAPFEGLPADFVFWHSGTVRDQINQPFTEPLKYTDDTQMMIAVAETLLAHGEIGQAELVQRFAANYEPERGYGRGARQILEAAQAGQDWNELAETVFLGGSFGNGAAMRVAPIGVVFGHDLGQVCEQAIQSARPTHRHPLGIEGARLMALAVALASHGPPLDRRAFYAELERECHEEEFRWQLQAARKLRHHHTFGFLGNSLPAHRSVVTAIACFTTCLDSYEDCIEKAITQGDDTDTIAAMAGALSGTYLGISAIPTRWLEALEDGPKGYRYLHSIADRLWQLHQRLTREKLKEE